MNREYHRWYSPSLERDMELLVFGHAGARVLVFPTSQGRFFQWEDSGMITALGEHLEQGWLQLFCVDSVDSESWYARWRSPAEQARRHMDIILATGRDDSACSNNESLSSILWGKNIWHALRIWDGWAHDWPWWQQMIKMYIGGHD